MLNLNYKDQVSVCRLVLLRELRWVEKVINDVAQVDYTHTINDEDKDTKEGLSRAVE